MKTNSVVYFRRKREGRTDYRKRLALLKSRLPRLVVRRTNKHTILQVVQYHPDGDKILATVTSGLLLKHGWKGSTANSAAAYLTGLLLAQKIKGTKLNGDLIVDIGLHRHKAGSRLYAAVRGAKDAGLAIKCSDDVLPGDERLNGEHLSADVKKSFETI
ncbi:50S ribosomal protein L18, partial [Candidatus Woesearchaeota archaeon]|nr:50S ribosomal protein L18 [Candidatus Woesearchaeota archaeon]